MSKPVLAAFVLALCLSSAGDAASVMISFQEGSMLPGGGSYSGTEDTEIQQGNPGASPGSTGSVRVDLFFDTGFGTGEVQGLLLFGNLFGALPDQIPLGSTINWALLTLDVFNSSTTPVGIISIYQMTSAWSESSTWDSLVGGVQIGSETVAVADAAHTVQPIAPTTFDVLDSLQAWSAGSSNLGWVLFNSDTDAIEFRSSEFATIGARPLLTVDFTPVPEPGSLVLTGLAGAAALCARGLRRAFDRQSRRRRRTAQFSTTE